MGKSVFRDKKKPLRAFPGAPREIRTPVLALKGLRPGPLDDGGKNILAFQELDRANIPISAILSLQI